MSGIRDNTVLMLMVDMSGKSLSEVMDSGWFKDPYDPDWKMGFLMNASENRMFDDAFPEHPLSMLRNLVSFSRQQLVSRRAVGVLLIGPFVAWNPFRSAPALLGHFFDVVSAIALRIPR